MSNTVISKFLPGQTPGTTYCRAMAVTYAPWINLTVKRGVWHVNGVEFVDQMTVQA